MSDEFRKKLASYEKGELTGQELEDFEKELDKLESYQEYLQQNDQQELQAASDPVKEKKQKKILRRGKWKARFQTAVTALGIFLAFTLCSVIFTGIYYSWGEPDRMEVNSTIIDQTLTVTNPYGYLGGTSTNTKAYFGMEASRDLNKRVGDEQLNVGEMKVDFLFSLMGVPEEQYYGTVSAQQPAFVYPGRGSRGMSDWKQLEDLPEGTVVSAYVSFSELMDTKEVIDSFAGKNMDLLWMAVDTGIEKSGSSEGIIFEPLGFPSFPIWHEDDFIVTDRKVEDGGWFGGKVVSEGSESPEYEEGDQEVLHKQFLKTLAFLEENESKANKMVFHELELSSRIAYLKKEGFQHYGAVITGPTKKILELQDEGWITDLEVDEVSFWNWTNR
ncbi:hypothetical protein D3H55_16970 [Bacillus salacetis]|uniref:Anti-sigma factor n=1 Tax=Bacillus salacetis TaxID=2315464 RepID=A0A3A1QSS2_9BACI|nr:anti-sigma factor [Bacillus salacetis]RIW30426.1 hypothetical protein D3H55_16970 [Bacillus salacetis]